MLRVLISWSASPTRMSTPRGWEPQSVCSPVNPSAWNNWCPESPHQARAGWRDQSSHGHLFTSVLQIMAYQTLCRDSNSWRENSLLKSIFHSKFPSPHLLEPWDGEEGRNWDGKKRRRGQREEGRGEEKNIQSKMQILFSFPGIFLSTV